MRNYLLSHKNTLGTTENSNAILDLYIPQRALGCCLNLDAPLSPLLLELRGTSHSPMPGIVAVARLWLTIGITWFLISFFSLHLFFHTQTTQIAAATNTDRWVVCFHWKLQGSSAECYPPVPPVMACSSLASTLTNQPDSQATTDHFCQVVPASPTLAPVNFVI